MTKSNRDKTTRSDSLVRGLSRARFTLLIVAAAAQLATVLITWQLWQVREAPANLPVYDVPQISFGILLLISLLSIPVFPKPCVWIHLAILIVATACDQMRLQPQFVAIWLLMAAVVYANGTHIVRWYLVSMWFWAGLHKLLSPDWLTHQGWGMAKNLGLDADETYFAVAVIVGVFEVSVALLAWFRPRVGAFACVMLHVGIVGYLLSIQWNYSVLPWNIATAIVGPWILWRSSVVDRHAQSIQCIGPVSKLTGLRIAFLSFMILPALFYIGWIDRCFAHVLYSDHLPRGLITHLNGDVEKIQTEPEFAAPFPCDCRLLRAYFKTTAVPGEKLHIRDPRPWLDDQYVRLNAASELEPLSRNEFFATEDSVSGYEFDDRRAIFRLTQAGVRLLRRKKTTMIYAAEFSEENYQPDLLNALQGLTGLEQLQMKNTAVTDADLDAILGLPRLQAIGLNNTAVTDAALKKLSSITTLRLVESEGTAVNPDLKQRLFRIPVPFN